MLALWLGRVRRDGGLDEFHFSARDMDLLRHKGFMKLVCE